MKIAICSDIHDNIWVLEHALRQMQGADILLFCGDLCAPFTLVQIAEGFPGPIHAVWGNNDGDKFLLTRQAARFDHLQLHGELADIEIEVQFQGELGGFKLGKLRIAINHYPEIARGLVRSGDYDLVCYGHDHLEHDEQVGEARLINPGELMGRFGKSSFVILDAVSGQVERCEVENTR